MGESVRRQEPQGRLGRWVSRNTSTRKVSSRARIRILGRKGGESVREPTHGLEKRPKKELRAR